MYLIHMQVEIGVKRFSVLHILRGFDIVNGNPVDYMHCVLLGVVKQLFKLWFTSTYHRCEWYAVADPGFEKGGFQKAIRRCSAV